MKGRENWFGSVRLSVRVRGPGACEKRAVRPLPASQQGVTSRTKNTPLNLASMSNGSVAPCPSVGVYLVGQSAAGRRRC